MLLLIVAVIAFLAGAVTGAYLALAWASKEMENDMIREFELLCKRQRYKEDTNERGNT